MHLNDLITYNLKSMVLRNKFRIKVNTFIFGEFYGKAKITKEKKTGMLGYMLICHCYHW